MGADALLNQYRDLACSLPKADHLEVLVMSKEELMKKVLATLQENESTTSQINKLCQNISSIIKDRTVHLYIDECWITVIKKFAAHMTLVNTLSYLYSVGIPYT